MKMITFVGLLATMVYTTAAAAVPRVVSAPFGPAKRIESTFAWKNYFLHNCSTPTLYANDMKSLISGGDCQSLRAWQEANNGGYYEMWDFSHYNNFTYKPIAGWDTCVLAVSHAVSNDSNDYAVVGTWDVIDLMGSVLSTLQVNGTLPTISGNFLCGPNLASLRFLIYNGHTGWSGKPQFSDGIANYTVNATATAMHGADPGNGSYTTGAPPPLPSVKLPSR